MFLFSWKICDYSWKRRKSRWPLSWMSPRRGTAKRNAVLNRNAKFSLDVQGKVSELKRYLSLKQWQAAWAKRVSNRKLQGEFVPSDSPWERPCFQLGTLTCVDLSGTHHSQNSVADSVCFVESVFFVIFLAKKYFSGNVLSFAHKWGHLQSAIFFLETISFF